MTSEAEPFNCQPPATGDGIVTVDDPAGAADIRGVAEAPRSTATKRHTRACFVTDQEVTADLIPATFAPITCGGVVVVPGLRVDRRVGPSTPQLHF